MASTFDVKKHTPRGSGRFFAFAVLEKCAFSPRGLAPFPGYSVPRSPVLRLRDHGLREEAQWRRRIFYRLRKKGEGGRTS